MNRDRNFLNVGRAELAYLKAMLKDDFVRELVDVVVRFTRYAKEEDRNRSYLGGSISKSYKIGSLSVKLTTHRYHDGGISDVHLTINGLRGSERFGLEDFVSKGEAFLVEEGILREKE